MLLDENGYYLVVLDVGETKEVIYHEMKAIGRSLKPALWLGRTLPNFWFSILSGANWEVG